MRTLCAVALLVLAVTVASAADRSLKPGSVLHRTSLAHGRPYSLYIPPKYSPRSSWPVVISSHGRGGSGKGEIGQWSGLAKKYGFIVACPDMCTATVNRPPTSKLAPAVEDEQVILSILKELKTHLRVNPRAVMVTGFSGGGNPSYWTGLRHPGEITHICTRGGNFAPQQIPRAEKVVAAGRKRLRIYIYYGENDHPLIVGEGGKPGQARLAHDALTKAGYENLKIDEIPAMKHQSRPDIAAAWFGGFLKENKALFAAGDKADGHLATAAGLLEKKKYRQAIRELVKMGALEKKSGLHPRAADELAKIDVIGQRMLAEAKKTHESGDAATALKLVGRIGRDFKGVPAGDEAKNLKKAWKD
jgi:dienelactone hydrolase